MKKVLLILLAALVLILAGCSGGAATQNGATSEATLTPDVTATPVETSTPEATVMPTQTPTEEPTEAPSAIPVPDILQLVLNENGTASNGVQGGFAVTDHGAAKEIIRDNSVGMNVVTFKGSGCVYNMDLTDVYGDIMESYSVEVFFKATTRPGDDIYWGIVDNQEAGGFGLNLYPKEGGGQYIKFAHKIDNEYRYPAMYDIELDKWYHCVITWDETALVMYVNGQKVGEIDTEYGIPEFTTVDSAMYLAIGGQCAAGSHGGNGFKGQMGICNLYTQTLTAEQVSTIYQNITAGFAG